MTTIKELDDWMLEHNIINTFTPNARYRTDEGLGLEEVYGTYIWYYIERGQREDIKHFKSEAEAVQFIQNYLMKNER